MQENMNIPKHLFFKIKLYKFSNICFALLCIALLHLLNTALLCIPFVPLLCQGLVCSSPHRLNLIFHVCFLLSPKHLECRLPTMVHPRAMPYSMQQSSSNNETTSNVVPKGTKPSCLCRRHPILPGLNIMLGCLGFVQQVRTSDVI